MIRLADFLAANPDALVHGPVFAEAFDSVCFDSRLVQPGQLFVAYKTARGDGHDYIDAACRGGAAGVVSQAGRDLASFGVTSIVVPDSQQAMERYAAHIVRQYRLRVVGITGSVGKTSAKEMLAHVLASRYRVFRNPANYSGYFGLPIALGYLEPGPELAVLEMAVDRFGEMALMARLAPPEVGIVTVVAPAHLAKLTSLEAIAQEKGVLVESLPADGLAVLNADDPRVAAMAARTPAPVAWYGSAPTADFRAEDLRLAADGTTFTLVARGRHLAARVPWLGAHFAHTALAVTAAAEHFGLTPAEVVDGLATLPPVPGRLTPLAAAGGGLVLDDTYNANPAGVGAGLAVLAALPAARRVAVLGDMAELGETSEVLHRAVGAQAAGVVDALVTRGKDAAWIADGARSAGLAPDRVAVTYTTEDAVAAVRPHLGPGTVVLVKGSAVTRMEQVVAALMAEPERAAEVLVRQDAAWRQIVVLRPDRPTWVEVDLGAIAANTRLLARAAAPARVMAVLKADAYGHGAVQVAHTALNNGAVACGVACLSEGQALRAAGIAAPVLVLGYTPAWQAHDAVAQGLTLTVFDADTAATIAAASQDLQRPARVHVKVDLGMHRLGLPPEEVGPLLAFLHTLPGLEVEGLFGHLPRADEAGPEARAETAAQLTRFRRLVDDLTASGRRPPQVHLLNSAGVLGGLPGKYDLVRPGIALYGLSPAPGVPGGGLRPALAWKTQVAQVRAVAPGEAAGYGAAWRAARPSRIATIPVGYADGFRRAPATWRHVLVRGRPALVVGRVSMDQTTVDVTHIPDVRQGDEVVLIGRQGAAVLTAETVADWLGTIHYEVVSAILARVPRVS
jgi:Alr-MurF fusion protein